MAKSQEIKEKIIQSTIELLKSSNGDVSNITIRSIAEKVDIGTGLINYHFGSKENLVEICVQRIISEVISVFKPNLQADIGEVDRLKEVAKQVLDFLISNPEISRISILGDMVKPMLFDNTVNTVQGFMLTLQSQKKDMLPLTYCFTLILQGLFLRKEVSTDILGFDFNNKQERDLFIELIIDKIYG